MIKTAAIIVPCLPSLTQEGGLYDDLFQSLCSAMETLQRTLHGHRACRYWVWGGGGGGGGGGETQANSS